MGPAPVGLVSLQKGVIWTETDMYTGKMPYRHEGGDRGDVSVSQDHPTLLANPWKLGERPEKILSHTAEETRLADT